MFQPVSRGPASCSCQFSRGRVFWVQPFFSWSWFLGRLLFRGTSSCFCLIPARVSRVPAHWYLVSIIPPGFSVGAISIALGGWDVMGEF